MGCPSRLPNQIDFYFTDLLNARQTIVDLLEDQSAGRTLLRGQGHGHFDPLPWKGGSGVGIRLDGDAIDQPQIDQIELHFRVKAVA